MTQARRHAAVKVKEGDVGQAVQETALEDGQNRDTDPRLQHPEGTTP